MPRNDVIALFVVIMIAIIIGADVAFLRRRFVARLIFNVGVVVVFGLIYLIFGRR